MAKQLGELDDSLLCPIRTYRRKRIDIIERIEQEVGRNLQAESLQLSIASCHLSFMSLMLKAMCMACHSKAVSRKYHEDEVERITNEGEHEEQRTEMPPMWRWHYATHRETRGEEGIFIYSCQGNEGTCHAYQYHVDIEYADLELPFDMLRKYPQVVDVEDEQHHEWHTTLEEVSLKGHLLVRSDEHDGDEQQDKYGYGVDDCGEFHKYPNGPSPALRASSPQGARKELPLFAKGLITNFF